MDVDELEESVAACDTNEDVDEPGARILVFSIPSFSHGQYFFSRTQMTRPWFLDARTS